MLSVVLNISFNWIRNTLPCPGSRGTSTLVFYATNYYEQLPNTPDFSGMAAFSLSEKWPTVYQVQASNLS